MAPCLGEGLPAVRSSRAWPKAPDSTSHFPRPTTHRKLGSGHLEEPRATRTTLQQPLKGQGGPGPS